jgi:4-amino-4-deoxy-L-arabinose transferase-like glycosyltransferase
MSEGRLAVLRQFHWLPAFTAMLLLILPWHVLAGLQNQGFWWDYIVNLHLLFFFDKKFPRDSIPDSLLVFWGAFFGRMFPWSACLPLALVWAGKRIWMDRSVAVVLPLIWLGIVLGFFTFSPSRLEHYTLPALPAAALVLGCWWSEVLVQPSRYVRSLGVAIAILGAIGLLGLLTAPTLLASETWAREFPILPTLAQWVCGASLTAAGMAGICLWHNSFRGVFIAIAGVSLPLFLNTYLALLAIEPINSWKLVGRRLMEVLPPDGEAIFAASDEYQICGGLNFYSHKPLSIVLPNGYIPPTYLDLDHHGPFLTQRDFLKRWQSDQPVVVIVDPDRPGLYTTSLVPPPVIEIDHWGERVMIANRAFAKRQVLMADSIHD